MLKKIKECNKGKKVKKILASLLAITLMFSNFTLLGSCIINGLVSYAADVEINNQDNKTNSENIVFEAYFMNKERQKVYEVDSDINSEDTKLYISLGVKDKGYLKNAKIELLDANFNFKNYENVVYSQNEEDNNSEKFGVTKTITLNNNQINAGETVSLKDDNAEEDGLTIRALTKSDGFNINSLKAISKIRLTGDYYEEDSEESIKINSEKQIKINWILNTITEENSPAKLEQEFITNKILTVNEENKRVVQLKIKSYLENNCYPIENTKIDIKLPKINDEQIEPEKITVVSYGTFATNGKDSLNFAKEQEEANTLGTWKYNQETQNIEINIKNPADENGNISWVKQGQDELIITYIYDENTVINTFTSEANSQLKLYAGIEVESEKNILENAEVTEIANPLSLKISAPKELYKKNMSMNKATEYNETWTVGLSNSEVVGIVALTGLDKLNISNQEDYNNSDTSYKSTAINKNEFINLLGKSSIIEIYKHENFKEIAQIGELKVDENSEEDIIIFNYPEDVKNILLVFKSDDRVLDGGKLNINHVKQINLVGDKEKLKEVNEIELSLGAITGDALEVGAEAKIHLKEPALKSELGISLGREDKTTLPVNQENEIDFTVTLHTDKEEYKLYNNPTVKIDLPQEVTNIELSQLDILNANGLAIKDKKVDGNSIIVELEGNQEEFEEYNYINTQLQIKAKIKAKELIPTLTRDVNLTVINNQNEEDIATDVKQVTFEQTTKGLILANSVSGYNNGMPEIVAIGEDKTGELQVQANTVSIDVKGTVVNNGQATNAIEILGNIVNESSNIEAILNSEITVTDGKVYYSQDGQDWTETIENAKQYKIVLEKGLDQGQVLEFSYTVQLPENLKSNENIELSYSIKEQDKEKQIESAKIKLKTEFVKVEVEETPIDVKFELMKNLSALKMGHEIGFLITITNTSKEDINNMHIEYDALKELAYKEVGFNVGRELFKKEGNTYKSRQFNLKAGESTVIFAYANIVNYNENGLINEILIKCEDDSKTIVAKNVKPIEKMADISMQITSNKQNAELKTDDIIEYSVFVKNNSLKDENIKVEAKLSEGLNIIRTQINNGNIIEESNLTKKEMSVYLKQGEVQEIKITAKVNAVQENLEKDLDVFAFAEAKIGEYLLTQTEKTNNIVKKLEKVITPEQSTGEENLERPVEPTVPEQPETPSNPEEGKQEEKPTQSEQLKKYEISGKAWLDEDKDGLIDKNEKLLKGVLVRIKQINKDKKAEYVKDEKGELVIAITDNNGQYKFENLLTGEYILEFEYNSKDYTVTPVSGKDSAAFISTTQEGTMVKTDTLKVSSNVENVNIGLVLNGVFDLELNKYISKITVKNNAGTEEYNYNKAKLAKVEIKAKHLKGSVVMIEYQIDVTNKGEVNANSVVVADYAPTELKFNSELNTTWYQNSDGTLCCTDLKNVEIKPGETKSVKLVLTKTMSENNTGIVENNAEISEAYNNSGLVDINSTPSNKNQKENDFSNAEVIISTATGSPIMYITIVIISMLILGGGIYLINKKVMIRELM